MYIFGNWKMYLTTAQARTLAKELQDVTIAENVTAAVFPSMIYLSEAVDAFSSSNIAVGAQNVAWTPQGAYTGAVSAHLVKESGASYALVGHSERRHIFGESNETIRKRLEACLHEGLTPVLCVGETREDLDAGKGEYRVKKQLMKTCQGLHGIERIIIAYEPVWAISKSGDGTPCSPEVARNMHAMIRDELKQYTDATIPVLYGGSVNAQNMLSFTNQEGIDGVLVGSASTKIDEFSAMLGLN